MKHIYYSHTLPQGEYHNGAGATIQVVWKPKWGPRPSSPPQEVHLTGTFPVQDVTKNMDRIAEALEGIYELLNRR